MLIHIHVPYEYTYIYYIFFRIIFHVICFNTILSRGTKETVNLLLVVLSTSELGDRVALATPAQHSPAPGSRVGRWDYSQGPGSPKVHGCQRKSYSFWVRIYSFWLCFLCLFFFGFYLAVCVFVCFFMSDCLDVCLFVRLFVCLSACTHICVRECAYSCLRVCISKSKYT